MFIVDILNSVKNNCFSLSNVTVVSKLFFPLILEEAQKTLEESMAMSMADHNDLGMELYRSHRGNGNISSLGSTGKRSTMGRKQVPQPPPILGKSPPRPSPASVPYNSDEESLKAYDENPDDSSVTEKPSEMSSSDSQVGKIIFEIIFDFINDYIFPFSLSGFRE